MDLAHHARRPPSPRPAQAARTTAAPRQRWSRFTTALALVGVSAVVTGGTAAHAEPSITEIEHQIDEDWNKLEPIIEQHNATRQDLTVRRRQAAALAARIRPLQIRVDQAMNKVRALAVRAYMGENASAVNAMLSGRSPGRFIGQLELLDQLARRQQEAVRTVSDVKDQLSARKTPLDRMVAQLTRTEAQLAAKKKQIDAEISRLQKLRLKAYGKGGGGPLRPAPCPAIYPGGGPGAAVTYACAQIGKPYVWGTDGPNSFDCSGLVLAAWAKAGVRLPHNAAQQRQATSGVRRTELHAGDLVFYYSDLHHVGMYVGNGWVVHASRAGVPVRMKRIDDGPIHSFGRPRGA